MKLVSFRPAALSFLLLSACGPGGDPPTEALSDQIITSAPATLRLELVGPSQPVRSTEPVRLALLLVNSGIPVEVVNSLDALELTVIGPDGTIISSSGRPEDIDLPTQRVQLPNGGILGRIVDLRCIRSGSTAAAVPEPCLWSYSFTTTGVYRVIASYRTVAIPGATPASTNSPIESDTLPLQIGPG